MSFGTDLCSRTDTLRIAYGRDSALDVSGSIVDQAIEDASREVYTQYGDSRRTRFYVDTDHTEYEFRKDNIKTYRLEKVNVWKSSNNLRRELSDSDYTADLQRNKITLTSDNASKWNGSYLELFWIPIEWHLLAKNKAALNLLDVDEATINPGENNAESPRITRIVRRITRIEDSMEPMVAVGSYENIDYDIRDIEIIHQDRFQKNPRY